jgi:hypothetical protein
MKVLLAAMALILAGVLGTGCGDDKGAPSMVSSLDGGTSQPASDGGVPQVDAMTPQIDVPEGPIPLAEAILGGDLVPPEAAFEADLLVPVDGQFPADLLPPS